MSEYKQVQSHPEPQCLGPTTAHMQETWFGETRNGFEVTDPEQSQQPFPKDFSAFAPQDGALNLEVNRSPCTAGVLGP